MACLSDETEFMIETTAELKAACDIFAKSDFVTVDTEFLRESTFWPQLA